MAAREEDPKLDAALGALAGTGEPLAGDDDARWAKRIASRVSTFPAPSRRDLDPLFDAPFPDGFVDSLPQDGQNGHREIDHAPIAADDHTNAASAADFGDAHGWEGSMSDSDSRPPNSLAALSGLTRSGPASNPDAMEGAAKGDDSGLINLKAMTEPPAPPEEVAAAAEAAAPVSAEPAKSTKAVAPISAKVPVASTASANAPPASSTQASAVSAPAAQPAAKKSSAVIWLGFAGVAAAAAAAFMFVGPMARKADESSAAKAPTPAAAEEAKDKKADDEKVAANQPPPAATASAPVDQAADPAQVHAPGKPMPNVGSKTGAVDSKALAATPTPSAKPTATGAEPPKTNPAGGSLDDVLGIGKDQPTAKKVETDNLPDKPESMDVRSAINSKLSGGNACVKGLDGPSNVSVTFGPTGTVSAVVVSSGPAKGTGAEACIKGAFSGAKVPASKKGATGSATLVP